MNQQTFLDRLTINTYSTPEGRRSMTRDEAFVLGWLIHHSTGRTYREMARECNLTLVQCEAAVQGLMEIDLLRLS